ncbi:hypothetical protein [Micromonospora sp. NPDC049679]|uniref:hypothetical protein n=1 Tax=Micromonospora sp. NPDC049679 TaxID=3155920 RepID=UPI0033D2C623
MTGWHREHLPREVIPLSPRQIREYELPYVGRLRKRGLEPEAVYQLLYRLAHQVAAQNVTTRAILEENERIKRGLSQWQSRIARQLEAGAGQDAVVYPTRPPFGNQGRHPSA